jgi:hypothetical protein
MSSIQSPHSVDALSLSICPTSLAARSGSQVVDGEVPPDSYGSRLGRCAMGYPDSADDLAGQQTNLLGFLRHECSASVAGKVTWEDPVFTMQPKKMHVRRNSDDAPEKKPEWIV